MNLLLLPGLDGTEVLFGPLVTALPHWITPRVVTYPTSGGNTYADLLPLIERSVAGAPEFWVLGWSFSGPLALMLAARLPGRVRGVIRCSSFVRSPLPNRGWLRLATIAPAVWLVRIARRAPARVVGARSLPLAEAQAMTWSRVPSRVIAERARAILALDARGPRRNADEIARERPDVRFATIDGGHLALFTNAGAAAQAIAGFMQSDAGGQDDFASFPRRGVRRVP